MSSGAGGGLRRDSEPSGAHEVEHAMKATVVRYQAKPDRAAENQQLIEAVFAELDERQPEGFTYKVLRLEDGVSFIHVVIEHEIDEPDSLQAVPAFQDFVADIADRCDVPPVAMGATVVGSYRRVPGSMVAGSAVSLGRDGDPAGAGAGR
jgi:predicted SnoaL-like aldol condensation-catalyzing enzyme